MKKQVFSTGLPGKDYIPGSNGKLLIDVVDLRQIAYITS
jgi:hypothetical protein